jgi:hypothetical protein
VKRLDRLHFLIHGFCYAEMALSRGPITPDDPFARYLGRENACAQQWRARLAGFADTEAVAIIPWPGVSAGPSAEFHALAASILGERCFLLDCPDCLAEDYWGAADDRFGRAVLAELRAACVGQGLACNQEEIVTDLHCLACCRRLEDLLSERGYALDRASASVDGWGASFDGCVTKYTLTLRRMLGLSRAIDIDYGLTVPDAAFLLDADDWECMPMADGLRAFMFEGAGGWIGLYALTSHSLADAPVAVTLPEGAAGLTVRSKQGIRLWPRPEPYALPAAPVACREPAQQVVTVEAGGLRVPASAGFVYRLAKAPAYLFAPPGMPRAEFRARLLAA